MKKSYVYCAVAALALTFTLPAAADAPAASAANDTAVINIQQIMRDATAAQNVRDQLEGKSKGFQAEITKKQEQLQKEKQELTEKRSVLSKSAFEEKASAFEKKVTSAQKEAQSKKAMLDGAFEHAINQIQKAVTDIIADMAKEKGFTIAIPSSQILYYDAKLDITADVLKRLNEKLPKLDVQFDAAPASTSDDSDAGKKSKKHK
jgi:Skp family chaperone for outer membrane proteins